MKTSITQVILGTLIILACVYIGAWMIFGVDFLLNDIIENDLGVLVRNYTPVNETLFDIARYAFIPLVLLAQAVVVTGAAWNGAGSKYRLALTQVVSGLLIVALSVITILWGYSFDCVVPFEGGPVLDLASARNLTVLTGLLGFIVAILGVVQFTRNSRYDTSEQEAVS